MDVAFRDTKRVLPHKGLILQQHLLHGLPGLFVGVGAVLLRRLLDQVHLQDGGHHEGFNHQQPARLCSFLSKGVSLRDQGLELLRAFGCEASTSSEELVLGFARALGLVTCVTNAANMTAG